MHPLITKSTNDIIQNGFIKLINHYKAKEHKVHKITSDSVVNNLMACDTHLKGLGVTLGHTPRYQHEQRIERYVRTIKDRCRAVLDSLPYDLPVDLYAELMHAVIININDLPNSQNETTSPRSLVEGTKLDLNDRVMIPFGTLAMFNIAGQKHKGVQTFLPTRSELGIVLGTAPKERNAVKCYLFAHKSVYIRHSFVVLEQMPINFEWKV
jgi:hypothetical protein